MIICDNIIFELQRIGGVSKVWSKIIQGIDKTNLDINFLEGYGARKNIFRQEFELKHPLIYERSPAFFRRVAKARQKADIFHSSYYRISKNAKSNIVTIHDFINEIFPESFRDRALARMKKEACLNADKIIVISQTTKDDLLKHYSFVDPGKVEVVYNGVDEEFYPDPWLGHHRVDDKELKPNSFFLFVGARGTCKNFSYALKFLQANYNQGLTLPLILVGGGSFSEKEKRYARELGLPSSAIRQLTNVDNNLLRRLYSSCQALLIPSIYEGFGLPALEASRCGALVLASRGGALGEIVGETDYAFDLRSKDDYLRVIAKGFDNTLAKQERDRLLVRSQRFGWESAVKRHAEIYGEL
ncbi:MAG: glycosyltransferase family 1 protein [Porticoccaceae bacterium]|nr:glycosyltransferase family 1 protein [Porticoccaceae bacterium]